MVMKHLREKGYCQGNFLLSSPDRVYNLLSIDREMPTLLSCSALN